MRLQRAPPPPTILRSGGGTRRQLRKNPEGRASASSAAVEVSVTQAIIEAGYGSSRAFYEHGAP
ncbi:MAG: hypothetical protein WBQ76_05940, partial [Candidatus Korobacteraceae bacterium]